jgi:hypothetical protein
MSTMFISAPLSFTYAAACAVGFGNSKIKHAATKAQHETPLC